MPNPVHPQSILLARPKEVCVMLGIAAPTLWRWARQRAEFPRPIKLGQGTTAWRVSDLEAFIERQARGAL